MTPSLRPSTSSRPESVIEKLRIESSDDGRGVGITILGVFVSANCSVILIVMASIFILVGAILSAISYRPRDLSEDLERFLSRQEWGSQLKIIGPVFVVIGAIMLSLGTTFCILGWKVTKDEEKREQRQYAASITSSLDYPYMPTISHALLRDPSFPLIVPKAKWTTPQIHSQQPTFNPSRLSNRPRSSSVQIPFMGGTIVPSNEIEAKVKKLKMRRNSLPAHHTIHDR